jgi:hypothetical protein
VQQLQVAKARLETSLSNEKEAVAAVKAKLAAANAGASQQTMLDLELADYKVSVVVSCSGYGNTHAPVTHASLHFPRFQRTAESLNSRISELEEQLASARMQNEDAEAKVADAASTQAKEDELKKKGEDSRIKMKAMLFQFKKELTERRAEGEKVRRLSAGLVLLRLVDSFTPCLEHDTPLLFYDHMLTSPTSARVCGCLADQPPAAVGQGAARAASAT